MDSSLNHRLNRFSGLGTLTKLVALVGADLGGPEELGVLKALEECGNIGDGTLGVARLTGSACVGEKGALRVGGNKQKGTLGFICPISIASFAIGDCSISLNSASFLKASIMILENMQVPPSRRLMN